METFMRSNNNDWEVEHALDPDVFDGRDRDEVEALSRDLDESGFRFNIHTDNESGATTITAASLTREQVPEAQTFIAFLEAKLATFGARSTEEIEYDETQA